MILVECYTFYLAVIAIVAVKHFPFSFSTLFSLASLQLGWTVACGLFLQVMILIGGGGFGGDDDDEDNVGVDGGEGLFASLLLLPFFSPSLNSHSLFIPTWSNISWI